MSINYQIIRESEKELFEEFKYIFNFVVNLNLTLFDLIKNNYNETNTFLNQSDWEKIQHKAKQIDIMNNDLLSDCVWMIQKNEPRADHLRFIVAIINSIKDIEKINHNILWITKFFSKRILQHEIYQNFLESYELTNNTSKVILEWFDKNNIDISKNEKLPLIFQEYHKFLKNKIRTTILIYSENSNILDNKTLIDLITGFGTLERTIEYQESIINSFQFIYPKR